MRILHQVPDSVLWLLADNPSAAQNLRHSAAMRGIDPLRLVFAPRTSTVHHLARHVLADLFIDTWPCNAHTTASDALWAGLPVLTRYGQSFASRVAASLLNAAGLPELITETEEAYESTAIRLAEDPARLADLKKRIQANRLTCSLFDSERFTQNLERAYELVMEAYWAGRPPNHIEVGRG